VGALLKCPLISRSGAHIYGSFPSCRIILLF
jgi:hypothetical protein